MSTRNWPQFIRKEKNRNPKLKPPPTWYPWAAGCHSLFGKRKTSFAIRFSFPWSLRAHNQGHFCFLSIPRHLLSRAAPLGDANTLGHTGFQGWDTEFLPKQSVEHNGDYAWKPGAVPSTVGRVRFHTSKWHKIVPFTTGLVISSLAHIPPLISHLLLVF